MFMHFLQLFALNFVSMCRQKATTWAQFPVSIHYNFHVIRQLLTAKL